MTYNDFVEEFNYINDASLEDTFLEEAGEIAREKGMSIDISVVSPVRTRERDEIKGANYLDINFL